MPPKATKNTAPLQKSSTILENNAFCLDVIEFIYKIPRQRIVRHGLGESTSQRIPLCVSPSCWDPLNIIVSKPMLIIEVQCLFVCIRKIMLFWKKTRKKIFNLLHTKCAIYQTSLALVSKIILKVAGFWLFQSSLSNFLL